MTAITSQTPISDISSEGIKSQLWKTWLAPHEEAKKQLPVFNEHLFFSELKALETSDEAGKAMV